MREVIPYSSPASSPSTNAWPLPGSHVTSPRSPAEIASGVCAIGSAWVEPKSSVRIRNVNALVPVFGGGAYPGGCGRTVGTDTVWPLTDPSGSLLLHSSPSNWSSVDSRQY